MSDVFVSRGRDGELRVMAPRLVYDVLTQIGDVFQNGTDEQTAELVAALQTWSVAHRCDGALGAADADDWLDDIEAAVNGTIDLGVPVAAYTAKVIAAALTNAVSQPERVQP